MGLPAGIGMHSPPKPSPNQYGRGVVSVLSRVINIASELSTPPVVMWAYPEGTPGRPQSPPPRTLICSGHAPTSNCRRPFSWRGPHSGCDTDGESGLPARLLSARTLHTSTGFWVSSYVGGGICHEIKIGRAS